MLHDGQAVAPRADHSGMEFTHACSFCGWERLSRSPVMLSPSCAGCGCALDARPARPSLGPAAGFEMAARWTTGLRLFGVAVALLALFAATRVGYDAAGASGGLIAFGMGCFLLVPFVPQRLR
jgi:hypothetical protein